MLEKKISNPLCSGLPYRLTVFYCCLFVCGFYLLATSSVISGWVLTCDSVHSLNFHSAVPLWYQSPSTMSQFPPQSHYPDTEQTSSGPIVVMPSVTIGSDKSQLCKLFGLTQRGLEFLIFVTGPIFVLFTQPDETITFSNLKQFPTFNTTYPTSTLKLIHY